jgi:prepilin-type N-terminal cleavage/methylation domain-containing protein
MNKQRRNEKGFTMIELIIVVAIMGILAAILVPSFASMSRKSRLTSDIRTLQTIQKQIDLYYAERGKYPTAAGTMNNNAEVGAQVGSLLVQEGYIESKYFVGNNPNSALKLQTESALAIWNSSKAHVEISSGGINDTKVKSIIANIKAASGEDADWLN